MDRLANFDCLRILAIAGIVFAHFCMGVDQLSDMGRFLAETFNCVFFSISALLLGLKWAQNKKPKYSYFSYIFSRYVRLSVALYPLLTIVFILFYFFSVPFSIKDVLMNFAFLAWFNKLPGFGHLWFLTMIMACYAMFVFLSRTHKYVNRIWAWLILIVCLILQYFADKYALPGYAFTILFYCGILFINAENFLRRVKFIKIHFLFPVYLTINIATIYLFYHGIHIYSHTYSNWLGVACGFSWIVFYIKLFENVKGNSITSILSSISFEIYLVHHPFCFGKFSVYNFTSSPFIALIMIILITCTIAYLLHFVSKLVNVMISPALRTINGRFHLSLNR